MHHFNTIYVRIIFQFRKKFELTELKYIVAEKGWEILFELTSSVSD